MLVAMPSLAVIANVLHSLANAMVQKRSTSRIKNYASIRRWTSFGVATPHTAHEDGARMALAAGKAVLHETTDANQKAQ